MYSSMHAGAPALKAHVKSVQQNTVIYCVMYLYVNYKLHVSTKDTLKTTNLMNKDL